MVIIYKKETGEVLYDEDKPVNYEDRKPVYKVIIDPVNYARTQVLLGYTMYYNPEVFATAQVPDDFREQIYRP